jgi:DNA-binding NarL/FixJ family response regulator
MKVQNASEDCKVSFLVADNDPQMRDHISKVLEVNYFDSEVITLFKSQDLLDKLVKYKPNVFIVDIDCDRIGYQILKLISLLKINVDVVAIGARSTESIALCLLNGVKGYIMKPIDNMSMIRTIDDILETIPSLRTSKTWA